MADVIITSAGLDAVINQSLPKFSIKYFLPIYDQRIDPQIHTSLSAIQSTDVVPFLSAATSADTHATLVGEQIWNTNKTNLTSGYDLTSEDYYVFIEDSTVVTTATGLVENTTQSDTTLINRLVDKTNPYLFYPLSKVTSGTVVPESKYLNVAGDFNYGTSVDIISATPPIMTSANRDYLWDGVTYSPSSASANNVTALFNISIPTGSGNFKFNKIAIYVQKLFANGEEDKSWDPVLFAQVLLNNALIISNNSEGTASIDINLQLDFNIGLGNEIYDSTEYWVKLPPIPGIPHGLFFQGSVAIGTSGIPNDTWQPRAGLEITKTTGPQLQLTNDYLTRTARFEVNDKGSLNIDTSAEFDPLLSVGPDNDLNGTKAVAIGNDNYVNAAKAHTFGNNTYVIGNSATALGNYTSAIGEGSLATGYQTKANGYASTIIGVSGVADGKYSFVGGTGSTATGNNSFAFGNDTWVFMNESIAFGNQNFNGGAQSFIFGEGNRVTGGYGTGHALTFGYQCSAASTIALAFGTQAIVGENTGIAIGQNVISVGRGARVIGIDSRSEGELNFTIGDYCRNRGNKGCFLFGSNAEIYDTAMDTVSIGNRGNVNGMRSGIYISNGYKSSNTYIDGILPSNMVECTIIGYANVSTNVKNNTVKRLFVIGHKNYIDFDGQNQTPTQDSYIVGEENSIYVGNYNYMFGRYNESINNKNFLLGFNNNGGGTGFAFGTRNTVSRHGIAIGLDNTAEEYSFAIGTNNYVGSYPSFLPGTDQDTGDTLAGGTDNIISGKGTVVWGHANLVTANAMAIFGAKHLVIGDSAQQGTCYGLTAGIGNTIRNARGAFALGWNNLINLDDRTDDDDPRNGTTEVCIGEFNRIYKSTNVYLIGSHNYSNNLLGYNFLMGHNIVSRYYHNWGFGKNINFDNTEQMGIGWGIDGTDFESQTDMIVMKWTNIKIAGARFTGSYLKLIGFDEYVIGDDRSNTIDFTAKTDFNFTNQEQPYYAYMNFIATQMTGDNLNPTNSKGFLRIGAYNNVSGGVEINAYNTTTASTNANDIYKTMMFNAMCAQTTLRTVASATTLTPMMFSTSKANGQGSNDFIAGNEYGWGFYNGDSGYMSAVVLIRGNGDIYTDSGFVGSYDEHDDMELVTAARYTIAGWQDKVIKEHGQKLQDLGIMENSFVSHNKMMALNLGAIGQLYNMVRELANRLEISEVELKELAKRYN